MNLFSFVLVDKTRLFDIEAQIDELQQTVRSLAEEVHNNTAYRPMMFGSVADLIDHSPLPANTLFVVQDAADNIRALMEDTSRGEIAGFANAADYSMTLVAGFDETTVPADDPAP